MTLTQGVLVSLLGMAATMLVNVALLAFWAGGRVEGLKRDTATNATHINGVGQKVRGLQEQIENERWRMSRALLEVAPEKAEKIFRIFMEGKGK